MKHTLLCCLLLFALSANMASAQLTGAVNPDIDNGACVNLDILLILDESSSMDGEEVSFRSGLTTFLGNISGHNNSVAVAEFGTAGRRVVPYTTINSGNELNTYINTGYDAPPIDYFGGTTQFTNYDGGFRAALEYVDGNAGTNYGANSIPGLTTARYPDWVIFFTDGAPNRSTNANGSTNTCGTGFLNATPSQSCANAPVSESDAFKAQGGHVFTVTVSADAQWITNEITGPSPIVWNGATDNTSNLRIAEYVVASDVPNASVAFSSMGLTCDNGNLPVELTSFDATLDGNTTLLTWTTASETNNAGFNIEHKALNATDWNTLQWIDGHGTTETEQSYGFRIDDLTPGRHSFRLKQIDYDGTFDYSPEVEVIVDLADRFVMEPAYPNPFNPQATMRFAVNRQQSVEVAMYDMLGRRVQVLWSGEAEAGRMQEVRIDGSGLSSGVYLVRAVGSGFLETQRVTLIK